MANNHAANNHAANNHAANNHAANNHAANNHATNQDTGNNTPQNRQWAQALVPLFQTAGLTALSAWLAADNTQKPVTLSTDTAAFIAAYANPTTAKDLTTHQLLLSFNNILAQGLELETRKNQLEQTNLNLEEQNQDLQDQVNAGQLRELHLHRQITNPSINNNTGHTRRKHPGHDPAIFTAGESNLVKRQQQFQTWQDKVSAALELDKDFFNTEYIKIHHVCNLLGGSAYEGIRDGLRTVKEDKSPLEWKWPNYTSLLEILQAQYVTTDLARQAKMDLDNLHQKKDIPFPNFMAMFKQLAERCEATDAEKKDLIKRKVEREMLQVALRKGLPKDSTFEDWSNAFMEHYLDMKELDHYTKKTTQQRNPQPYQASRPAQVTQTTAVYSSPDAMDLSVISPKTSFIPTTSGGTNPSYDHLKGQPRPLDPHDVNTRPWCIANRACYYCKDTGHQLPQCPKKGKTSRNFAPQLPQLPQQPAHAPQKTAPYPQQRQIGYQTMHNRAVDYEGSEATHFTTPQSTIAPSQSISQATTPTPRYSASGN
jgi:hypothetical protein